MAFSERHIKQFFPVPARASLHQYVSRDTPMPDIPDTTHKLAKERSIDEWNTIRLARFTEGAKISIRILDRVMEYKNTYPPYGLVQKITTDTTEEYVPVPEIPSINQYSPAEIADRVFVQGVKIVFACIADTFLLAEKEELAYLAGLQQKEGRTPQEDALAKSYQHLQSLLDLGNERDADLPTVERYFEDDLGTSARQLFVLISHAAFVTDDEITVQEYFGRIRKSYQTFIVNVASQHVNIAQPFMDTIFDLSSQGVLDELTLTPSGGIDMSDELIAMHSTVVAIVDPMQKERAASGTSTLGCAALVPANSFPNLQRNGNHIFTNVLKGSCDFVADTLENIFVA